MRKYDKYKPSGVDWIGEVPDGWEIKRGKYAVKLLSGYPANSDLFTDDESFMPLIRIRDINEETTETFYKGSFPNIYLIKKNDVLVGMDGDFNIARWKGKNAILNQRVCKVFGTKNMNANYSYYLFNQPLKLINDVTYSTTVKHLSTNDLMNYFFPVPPLSEQTAIAAYLDDKCSKIDNVIGLQQKRIALLKELKQSTITKAVTKGLDKNVKMKDSGVEWIGEVPEGWTIAPFKRFLSEAMKYGANAPAEEENNSLPRYIRITDIDENGCLKGDDVKSLNLKDSIGYMLDKGDLLFARSGATVGKSYMFNENFKACYAGYLIKAKCKSNLLPKFVIYYTQSNVFDNWKSASFIQSTIQNISAEKYSMLPCVVPPIYEQNTIASYLDKKCATIDRQISKIERQIELLKEYKQSVIIECVTGKRKVCQ